MAVQMPDLVAYGKNKSIKSTAGSSTAPQKNATQMPDLVAYGKWKSSDSQPATTQKTTSKNQWVSTGGGRKSSTDAGKANGFVADASKAKDSFVQAGRVKNTVTGAAKTAGAGYVNVGGMLAEGAGKLNTAIANANAGASVQSDIDAVKSYQNMLRDMKWADGKSMTAADVKKVQGYLAAAERRVNAHQTYTKAVEASDKAAADKAYQKADELQVSGEQDIAKAKEGLGTVGQFAVDLGVAGAQMAGDMAASAVVPGAGLALMGVRSGGSAAQKARQAGATYGQQLAYGIGSGALSLATEKISNVATPFKKAFGGGVLDRAISSAVAKMNGNAAGKLALSMLSEGGEEFIEDVFQPVLQRATYDKNARFDLSEALYDAAVGAAMGGIGGAVDIVRERSNTPTSPQEAAGAQTDVRESSYAHTAQAGAEGAQNAASGVETARKLTSTDNMLRYRSDIDKVFSGDYPSGKLISVGDTPEILARFGANPLPLTMSQDAAYKIAYPDGYMGGKHNLGMSVLKQLPYQIENPVAILKSNTQPNSIVMLTAWKDGDKSVIVPLHLDKQGAISVDNRIASAYQTGHIQSYLGESDGNVLYTKNNEDIHQLLSNGVQFPKAMADDILAKNSVSQEETKSNRDILSEILFGKKRANMDTLTPEQQNAVYQANEAGTVGMDASGKVFQIDPEQHIDRRNMESVGSKEVNAFQFDHPELHSYYQQAAADLIADADLSLQMPQSRRYERGTQGNAVVQQSQTSQTLRTAMDETGLSRGAIIDAAQRIINDQGQENVAAAKRVELILDGMLSEGYTTMDGRTVAPNERYLRAKGDIPGMVEQSREPLPIFDMGNVTDTPGYDNLGSARQGFTTPGMEGTERTSRLAESMPYNQWQEAATGLSREDYAKIFRYESQTEGKSLHLAEELVYAVQDGKKTFLRDIDEGAFHELVQSLDDATAWNGPQMDAARMIQSELQGKSANMEIPDDEYTNFLKIMREHETSTGQGVQANAKWSRNDNNRGQSTELDAWNNLEKSKLSDAEKHDAFQKIVKLDTDIEAVKSGDTQAMKDIILDVANERGVLGGATKKIADKALDSLTFDQLKQFAYASTSAMSTDATPANAGRKVKTIQILSMLSNPKTASKNIVGNTSFYLLDALSMKGGALLDTAVSKLTGTRSVANEKALSREALQSAMKAANMSIAEIALDVDMGSDQSRYGTGSQRTFKMNGEGVFNTGTRVDKFGERVLSTLERNQAYLLNATDEFFKGASRNVENNIQKLVDEGKIKTTDKDYAKNQAEQLAKYRTFQDNTKLSAGIQAIHDVLNLVGFGDSGKKSSGLTVHSAGLGDIAAPFTRVAGNLVSRGAEYSPYNVIKGTGEIVGAAAKAAGGNVDVSLQAKGVSDFARGMTGTMIAAGFMAIAKMGLLRKADDEDNENVAALNRSEGMTGTQFNWSAFRRLLSGGDTQWQNGDTLIDVSSIEPLNLLMDLGTEMAKSDENPVVSSFKAAPKSLVDASSSLPVVQFIGDVGTDVLKYGNDPIASISKEAASALAASVVPNVLRATAQGLDDRPRTTQYGDSFWEKVFNEVKSRVPGARETLPGSVDSFGNDRTYQGDTVKRLTDALLNPLGVNQYQQSEVSKELEALRKRTGNASFYPAKAILSSVTYTDKNGTEHLAKMDYVQRQQFQKVRGSETYDAMEKMVSSSAYKNAGDKEKIALLTKCKEYGYEAAKGSVLGSDASKKWVRTAKEERIPQHMYAAYKVKADRDGNGKVSSVESAKTLQGLNDLSNAQRGSIWAVENTTTNQAKNPFTGALPQAGISSDTAVSVLAKYNELYNADMKPKEKAAAFKAYVYGLGLTGAQMAAVRKTYTFFGSYPVEW